MRKILFAVLILLFIFSCSEAEFFPPLPEEIYFAGQKVNLENRWVRERIEQEFYDFLNDKESFLIAKRTGRYFPLIEEKFKEMGLHDDFKYLAIAESNLKLTARSSASASGIWQFMPATAKRFGLKISYVVDERYDPVLANAAAAKYLKTLISFFKGDVFLVIAGYNTGEGNILTELKKQGIQDFWSLYYRNKKNPNETMRYAPRAIAAKIVFENIEKYFGLKSDDLYKPLEEISQETTVEIKEKSKSLIKLAKENNITLLDFKLLNPQIKSDFLPRGKYKIRFPKNN